jgi:hypothetical protein
LSDDAQHWERWTAVAASNEGTMANDVWVYKCNREEQPYSIAWGDWGDVFTKKGAVEWGGSDCTTNSVSTHILNVLMKPDDLILAYQTNDRTLVGVCRVAKLTGGPGEKRMWLKPLYRFDTPIPVHDLKRDRPELLRVRAFASGFPQMLYAVSKEEREVLAKLCGVNLTVVAGQPVLPPRDRRAGAGFGEAEENKKVEQAAVRAVEAWYLRRRWKVTKVEAEKRGYDLICTSSDAVEHVEVKGVRGSEPSFIITAGELKQAETNVRFVICIVTAAGSARPRVQRLTGTELCQRFAFRPLQYHATPKAE